MKRFANIFKTKTDKHYHTALTAKAFCPQNRVSYYVIGKFHEQDCKFTANNLQICLIHMCFLSEYSNMWIP